MVSGVVALTLSPVLCATILKHNDNPGRFERGVHRFLDKLDSGYAQVLSVTLNRRPAILLFALCVFGSLYFLFRIVPTELAPAEDKGALMLIANGPASANMDFVDRYTTELGRRGRELNDVAGTLSLSGIPDSTSGLGIVRTKVWDQREMDLHSLTETLQEQAKELAGVNTSVFPLPALPGAGGGLPIQFVVKGSGDYRTPTAAIPGTVCQSAAEWFVCLLQYRFEVRDTGDGD